MFLHLTKIKKLKQLNKGYISIPPLIIFAKDSHTDYSPAGRLLLASL